MAIHLTRIYTRTGDDGTSALGDFSRVAKTDPRLVAYADTDETNAALGVARAFGTLPPEVDEVLARVQNDLFDVGADLSVPLTEETRDRLRVTEDYVTRLEEACDRFNESLAPLTSFVLPGGSQAAAQLHVARTIARRAERTSWALIAAHPDTTSKLPATYLNRLSDLLFILSRVANDGGTGDVLWQPGGASK
jgi:cob(I)alamin adenosyltransferase